VVDAGLEERKVVSVLFVDLVGFTAHTAQSDPEDVRARLTVYHREIREDVERFGGRVEKLMGDGVFAVFGAPLAHEDDPERAVRAALRMQRSVDDLNATHPELSLSIRTAVTTGEAIVQIEGDDPDREGIIGDVVNTASRLEAVAPPGGIVVDERTYLATRDAVVYADLDPVDVKGKVEPLPIWQPLEARSRHGVDVDRSHSTPFVGRDAELGVLVDAFDRTVKEDTVQLVTIIGEPGVGKSRLLNEFRESIDARPDLVWWRQGRCLPYGDGITFWALAEIVKAHAGILDSDTEAQAQAKLQAAVKPLFSDPSTVEWVRARLETLSGVGGVADGIEQTELFSAWSRFFEALAARNPLVIVVEDLHWADEAMLDFLEHITDWAVSSPILVVATARPELFSLRGSWGGGKRNATTVSLSPLNAEQAAVLLGALLETTVLDAAVQQAILDRSEGNPLYVTEFVRLADDKGLLRDAAAIAGLSLPGSVQAVVAARLDLLPAEEKAALQAAAVVGKTFWVGALRSLRPTFSIAELVRNLIRRELIRPVRDSSMHAQQEYAFSHSVIRDVCYGQIPKEDRARLHEATAAWIDTVTGPQGTDTAELLAYHLGEAVSLSSVPDPELELRSYQVHMQAGERARGLSTARAAGYYRIAVEHAGSGTDRGHALLELSDTMRLNEPDRVRPLLDEALALFREASDVEGEATALSMLAGFLWWRGETSDAYAHGHIALELVKDLPASAAKARVMMTRASGFYLSGDAAAALEVIDQAAAVVAAAGTPADQVGFMYTRGGALVELGDPSGLDDLQAAAEMALDRNMTHAAVTALNNLATVVATARSTDEGLAAIDRGIDLCEERGAVAGTIWASFTKCEILVPAGRWDEVLEIADDVIARDAEIGGSQAGTGAAQLKAIVLFYRGREAEARALHDSVLDATREIADRQVLVPALSFAATLAADAGDKASVLSLGAEYGSVTADNPGMRSYHLADLTAALAAIGAAELLDQLVRSARPVGALGRVQVARARGHLATVKSDWRVAADHFGRATAAAGLAGRVVDGTLARIEKAGALAAAGAAEEIPQLLDEARAQAQAMGATKILGWIDASESGETAASE
jgi:class 3 adenylate cyclase/tetratricopeptide (TPR) repeat protein